MAFNLNFLNISNNESTFNSLNLNILKYKLD